jgi:hypothetical protein
VDFYFRSSEIFKDFLVSEDQKVGDGIFLNYEYLSILLKNIAITRKNFNRFNQLKPYNIKFQGLLGFNPLFKEFNNHFKFVKNVFNKQKYAPKTAHGSLSSGHKLAKNFIQYNFLKTRGESLYRYRTNLRITNRKDSIEKNKIKISANALYNSVYYNFIKKFQDTLSIFSLEVLSKETYGRLRTELQPIKKRKRIRKKIRFF